MCLSSLVNGIQRKVALPIQIYKQSWISPAAAATGGEYVTTAAAHSTATLEDIMNEFSARDPKTIEAELKDIYE
jgi:hypothetical protein